MISCSRYRLLVNTRESKIYAIKSILSNAGSLPVTRLVIFFIFGECTVIYK